ncbi:MAG: DNA alkylation repair protein [Chloroflexota bacterium]|nr:MAG: DNA alkylation repair protein [Chloroflexota bacterium]
MNGAAGVAVAPTRPLGGQGPSASTERARAFVAARLDRAVAIGRALGDEVQNPAELAEALKTALTQLADPEYLDGQHHVAPGLGPTHGVRTPLLGALGRGFRTATRRDSPSTLLFVADRLLGERELEAHWFAFGILERTLPREPERTWQLLRRAGRDAADWITVDSLAHPMARGILAEPYRWAELEQLVYAPSRWERRLVGSTIATIPFVSRTTGRTPDVVRHGLEILGTLIGDAEADVQKAVAWAYRSMAVVDRRATTAALVTEADTAARTADGYRAWVIRDARAKLDPADAARLRARLDGIRRRPGAPSTSRAAETAARFADLPLGGPMPEPPLT